MEKVKILMDGRALLDPKGGGVYEYASSLLSALRRRGEHDYRVWTNQRRPVPAETRAAADVITRWPNKVMHAGMRFAGRPRADALARGSYDLLWMPNPHFVAASPSLPLAVTFHDLSFERYPDCFSTKRRLWHKAIGPKRLARRADLILAVSEHTKRDLVDLYDVPPERIAVTYEGCDPGFFDDDAADAEGLRSRLGLPERFLLHVGAFEPRKNHLGLISAFEVLKRDPRHADLGLVLAGPSGWKNRTVMDAVRRSPEREAIRMIGFVDADDRPSLYRAAEAFVFPSLYEGFGLPPLEAMASGTPVVASFASSLGEIVDDAGILTDPYRPSEMAAALAAVLASPALAGRLREKGRARARRFSWEACADRTADAFSAKIGA